MGLGAQLRNLTYTATDSNTGQSENWTVFTDGPGLSASWADGYAGAMGLPGAWRAAQILSDKLGDVPFHVYEDGPDGTSQRVTPTPMLFEQPAPPDNRVTSFSSLALDLVHHGNGIALIAGRDRDGMPTSAVPVPADQVAVWRVEGDEFLGLRPGDIAYHAGGLNFAAADVIHIKGPCRPGALRGMGLLEAHLQGALKLATEQDRQAGNLGLSGVPTGVLKVNSPDLTAAEATAIKTGWLASQRERTVAVLNAVTDFEPVGWNPTETQLLDARKYSLHTIALIYGLDPSWLGAAQASRTYSNIEQEAINFVRYSSYAGHLARFEAAFSAAMPAGRRAAANLDALLRADTLGRYQAHALAITSGFLTADEVRAYENRAPLTAAQRAQIAAAQAAARPAPPAGGGAS